jgi:hypothetical protein
MRYRTLVVQLFTSLLIVPMFAKAEDIHFTATGQEDGKPLIFRSITSVPGGINKSDFPDLVAVSWRYEANEQGMPDADTSDAQNELEDALVPLDANHLGRQMLVVTGNSRKEWYWYVKDAAGWEAQARSLIGTRAYPIRLTTTNDHEWSFYENFKASVEGLE